MRERFADNAAAFASNVRSVLRLAEPAFYGTLALLLISQIFFVTGYISWPEVMMIYSGIVLGNMAVCSAAPVTGWLASQATRLVPQPEPQPVGHEAAARGVTLRTRFVRVARILSSNGRDRSDRNNNTGPTTNAA